MFTKLSSQLDKFSKEDIQFIIQKKTCEKPNFFKSQVQSNIVDYVTSMKEDYGIVEKMEFDIN